MSRGRAVIDCKTAEEVGRALYLGYSARCPEEVARQLGAYEYPEGEGPFTDEELEESIDRPYGDEEPPPPGTEYEEILRLAGTARERGGLPEDAARERPALKTAAPAAARPQPLRSEMPASGPGRR